ncbi:MAG: BadF/BadG/BcrA/BcrD ATPase family protein, partial [bacterium]
MKNKSALYYIGIDSGGTKCELLIASENKKITFKKLYKGVHYSVCGPEIYSDEVSKFIFDALRNAGLKIENCISICFGIAGAREDKDRVKLKKLFRKKLGSETIVITTDAMTALYGAFEGEEGIILISGTGSVLYGFSKDKITRVGGWGRIIGDEGSGYWIGKRALNLAAKEYDRKNIKESLFTRKLEQEFGITKENINQKTFSTGFEIQSVAPLVLRCAASKCRLSLTVVNEAVSGLLELLTTFLEVSKRKSEIQMSFIGSIVENKNIISD